MNEIIESKIGAGSSGAVFKMYTAIDNYKIYKAVKISLHNRSSFFNILDLILYFTKSNYIVKASDYMITNKFYKVYMPLAICNLNKLYRYKTDIRKILYDIALGVKYLHDRKIIHGDIKPSNILLFRENGRYIAKITDFNLSMLCIGDKIHGKNYYTNNYKAPEVVEHNICSFKTDIWALGRTFLKINTNESSDMDFRRLISKMSEYDENKRINIDQVLNDDYFRDFENPDNFTFSYDYSFLVEDIYNKYKCYMDYDILKKILNKENYIEENLLNYEIFYCKDILNFWNDKIL